MKKIYLDNGASTRTADEVVQAMLPYFTERYGNPSSLHESGRSAKEAMENARQVIAEKINADPEEIIFTSGGSESDNMAIRGMISKEKNHVITSKTEHPAVLKTCRQIEDEGFNVTYLDVDREGFVSLEQLESSITPKTALVTIMHANNDIGTIQPIGKIGEICRKNNVVFHTDAVQGFAKVIIDVKKHKIDMASFSGHKIHAPKGIGALYIRKGVRAKKMIYGGDQEHRMRAGTENIPSIVGFAKAVEISDGSINSNIAKLRDNLIEGIRSGINDVILNGPEGEKRLCNNANISFRHIEGESLMMHLDNHGIAVSTGSACSSQSLEPSHVLTAIGLSPVDAHGSIRFTLSRYTTKEDIEYTIKRLIEIVESLRKISPLKEGELSCTTKR